MDMLGDQEGKKVTQYTRAWYITKGMFKKTSGEFSMDGCILLHCYLSNSTNSTLQFNIAENETIVAELNGSCMWKG